MRIEEFEMERWQSVWENQVQYNLSESGVHPLKLRDLVDPADQEILLETSLGYPQTNGSEALRSLIADLYPGATAENITVANGTAEANFVSAWAVVEPGDEVVVMLPNYMQLPGLVRSLGGRVRPLPLLEDSDWGLDLTALDGLGESVRLIAVCQPNNPTGSLLGSEEIDRIVDAARRTDAWILSDEVYRGAELDGHPSLSFWGRYEKLLVTAGLSKAYGLPGLRIGWIATSPEMAQTAWSYRDYTTIAPSATSDVLARVALSPEVRARLLERTRAWIQPNARIVGDWVKSLPDRLSWVEPRAGAIAFVRYQGPPSMELAVRLRDEMGVLIEPGVHFGLENYMRIGFGCEPQVLNAGLERISDVLRACPVA